MHSHFALGFAFGFALGVAPGFLVFLSFLALALFSFLRVAGGLIGSFFLLGFFTLALFGLFRIWFLLFWQSAAE